jgi:hypothetical protein
MNHQNTNSFDLTNPINIVVYFAFFSSIILPSFIIFAALFCSSILKGILYLIILVFFCFLRSYFYSFGGGNPLLQDNTICTSIKNSKYGNSSFSAFVFSFTIMYFLTPMYFYNSLNYELILGLVFYFVLNYSIRTYFKCSINTFDLIKNIIIGGLCAFFTILLLSNQSLNTSKYLFFNEISSNKEVCSMPSTQTFKCNMYKNGEMIGSL